MQILLTILTIAVGLFAVLMVFRSGQIRSVRRKEHPVLYWIGFSVLSGFVVFYSVIMIQLLF